MERLERLLRAAISLGIFAQIKGSSGHPVKYRNNRVSATLRKDHPSSVCDLVSSCDQALSSWRQHQRICHLTYGAYVFGAATPFHANNPHIKAALAHHTGLSTSSWPDSSIIFNLANIPLFWCYGRSLIVLQYCACLRLTVIHMFRFPACGRSKFQDYSDTVTPFCTI